MPRVHFVKEEKVVEVQQGANLRQVALENGVDLYELPGNCHGFGLCGKCRVRVGDNAGLSGRTLQEKFHLGDEEEQRLACRCSVTGDVEVTTRPSYLGWFDHPYYERHKR